jgi:hypothetical protein
MKSPAHNEWRGLSFERSVSRAAKFKELLSFAPFATTRVIPTLPRRRLATVILRRTQGDFADRHVTNFGRFGGAAWLS